MDWHGYWENSDKGDETKQYFPNVLNRLACTNVDPNYYTMQFLTRHEDFKETLYKMNLENSPICECGDNENSWQVLIECPLFEEEKK